MLSFRDGAQRMNSECFARDLMDRVCAAHSSEAARLGVLLRTGELESALEDQEHPATARARQLSDDAAEAYRTGSAARLEPWLRDRSSLAGALPAELVLRRPEGYAYYALDPGAYARAIRPRQERSEGVAVVGVRSIGTSLSAVVLAELRARGARAERITVRPTGHPWDRQLDLSPRALEFVWRWSAAHFLIVDEGPGLSGSTFLAVAEALEASGVSSERIEFLTSHRIDPARLVARDGAQRWQRYLQTTVPAVSIPDRASDLSGGAWRARVYDSETDWPACNGSLERHKYREPGGALIKFIGLPPYGEGPMARGQLLADAGFCPELESHAPGYVAQRWIEGRPLRAPVANPRQLERLLNYLVFRSQACRAEDVCVTTLQYMLRLNVAEAIGWDIPAQIQLHVERPVYADARLASHEWIESADGGLFKVDATDHGDDHSFPGPCDSAWDIAGAILEWRLEPAAARELCAEYRRRTRDDVELRLGPYLLAYAALQVGSAQMAALSSGPSEQPRWACKQHLYTEVLRRLAASHGWHESSCASSTCS